MLICYLRLLVEENILFDTFLIKLKIHFVLQRHLQTMEVTKIVYNKIRSILKFSTIKCVLSSLYTFTYYIGQGSLGNRLVKCWTNIILNNKQYKIALHPFSRCHTVIRLVSVDDDESVSNVLVEKGVMRRISGWFLNAPTREPCPNTLVSISLETRGDLQPIVLSSNEDILCIESRSYGTVVSIQRTQDYILLRLGFRPRPITLCAGSYVYLNLFWSGVSDFGRD